MAFSYLLAKEENKKNLSYEIKRVELSPILLDSTKLHGGDFKNHSHATHAIITHTHKKQHKIHAIDVTHSLEEKLKIESSETSSKELGYFIIEKNKKNTNYKTYENIKSFLIQTTLPKEVKKEIKENKLKIKASSPYQRTKKYVLVPYIITKES